MPALSFEESDALRHVAGYVCCTLWNRLHKSSNPKKDDLLLGVADIISDDQGSATSSSWVRTIDRGGLVHVHESVYTLFVKIELRNNLRKDQADSLSHNLKLKKSLAISGGYFNLVSSDY